MTKPLDEYTPEELEAEGREVLAWIERTSKPVPKGERVVNILTGEVTEVPEGWDWDNYMEMLHS